MFWLLTVGVHLVLELQCTIMYCIVLYCIYLKGFSKSKWMLITEVSHINIARKMGKWGRGEWKMKHGKKGNKYLNIEV